MAFNLRKAYNTQYIECDPSDFVIRNERDVLDLVAACGEQRTHRVLLYGSNLSPDFFNLKTKLAGTVLQKFANYHIRGAAVISFREIESERFKELMFELSKGSAFRFFEDINAAEKWLTNA